MPSHPFKTVPVALVLFFATALTGCAGTGPNGETGQPVGRPPAEIALASLEVGVTDKTDVERAFGQPYLVWLTESVYVYRWMEIGGTHVVSTSGLVSPSTSERQDLLLIQFDDRNRIRRFERTQLPALEVLGEYLKAWVAHDRTAETG